MRHLASLQYEVPGSGTRHTGLAGIHHGTGNVLIPYSEIITEQLLNSLASHSPSKALQGEKEKERMEKLANLIRSRMFEQ